VAKKKTRKSTDDQTSPETEAIDAAAEAMDAKVSEPDDISTPAEPPEVSETDVSQETTLEGDAPADEAGRDDTGTDVAEAGTVSAAAEDAGENDLSDTETDTVAVSYTLLTPPTFLRVVSLPWSSLLVILSVVRHRLLLPDTTRRTSL